MTVGAWIPCSERLPDNRRAVLVWIVETDQTGGNPIQRCELAQFGAQVWWAVMPASFGHVSPKRAVIGQVTHWAPVSAPGKE